MPSVDVFAQFGFLVRPQFLTAAECTELIAEVSEAPSEQGRLVKAGVDGILDENTRRVSSASVCPALTARVKRRFLDILPDVRGHFGMTLAGCETPGFLAYDEGAFFAPHRDTGPDDPPDIRKRVVSAIVFLNQQAAGLPDHQAADATYAGGTLMFHELLDGLHWKACPVPFRAVQGMLVAFRSDVLHEVQPVTAGRRFTIVTWFLAR